MIDYRGLRYCQDYNTRSWAMLAIGGGAVAVVALMIWAAVAWL